MNGGELMVLLTVLSKTAGSPCIYDFLQKKTTVCGEGIGGVGVCNFST